MLKTLFRRIALGNLAPEYLASHAIFWPDRFALLQLPDRCPICTAPGVARRTLEGVEWVGVALRGGFNEVRRGTLPAKSVVYCEEHAPPAEAPAKDGKMPGLKITGTTENGFSKEVVVECENLAWMELLREASRQADENAQQRQVAVDRARLEETIKRMPGWTLGS